MTSQIGGALPIEFGPITTQNVGVLRVLNQVIFPVRYTDSFYTDIVSTPRELSKFGTSTRSHHRPSFIVATVHRLPTPDGLDRVYIMTLGVLEPYRKLKLGESIHDRRHVPRFMGRLMRGLHTGGALLDSVLAHCERTHMDHIYLHVQTSNADAIRFYTTHGFRITQTIYNYYRNISPPDCYILARSFASRTTSTNASPCL
ncbi:hypothetical protein DYB25_002188 [Aphanomyces astaci]|uniref:N-acetyltransferase domain-containing protein n=1 Tax=Aphanomyces astaci TaxID=112090 RepID=A0A397E5E1_APHAT|nr:hypothetical protein DYB25_002188 [Aphanomyces astaci]RHY62329.1 hypothetical protein DYB34_003582 [Aphanomyces astaci]RHY64138.1 hypothetical protein DYB38_003523 [Aphanomyces astaci]RHY73449.1 hypothetical protein DYB30_003730 [Aphanomyces astaci]RHY80085.1 hypothetical protein DYB31_004043 [Aphanomyces astaci]